MAAFANGSHYDMDILNYVFNRGPDALSRILLLPPAVARLDAHFLDGGRDADADFQDALYVHFSAKKPFVNQGRPQFGSDSGCGAIESGGD